MQALHWFCREVGRRMVPSVQVLSRLGCPRSVSGILEEGSDVVQVLSFTTDDQFIMRRRALPSSPLNNLNVLRIMVQSHYRAPASG